MFFDRDFLQDAAISAIRPQIRVMRIFFIMHARHGHVSTSGLKYDINIVFATRFPQRRETSGDSRTFKADVVLLILAWICIACNILHALSLGAIEIMIYNFQTN